MRTTYSTVDDFARRWKLHPSTVWAHIKAGRIRVVRLGTKCTRISSLEEERLTRDGIAGGVTDDSQLRDSA
jgi:hypothetical protein